MIQHFNVINFKQMARELAEKLRLSPEGQDHPVWTPE
jgi:hypothetical protein